MQKIAFLYDLIVGTFYTARTHTRDRNADEYENKIAEAMGYRTNFMGVMGQVLAYTDSLTFQWGEEDVPEDIRAIETFWKQYTNGVDLGQVFKFYSDNVANIVMLGLESRYEIERVTDADLQRADTLKLMSEGGILYKNRLVQAGTLGWNRAMLQATAAWQPPRALKLLKDLSEEEQANPLS